jgi:hypothetical protein
MTSVDGTSTPLATWLLLGFASGEKEDRKERESALAIDSWLDPVGSLCPFPHDKVLFSVSFFPSVSELSYCEQCELFSKDYFYIRTQPYVANL